MTRVTEAVYSAGVLTPIDSLDLNDQQRVRIIVQTIDVASNGTREEAVKRLREGIASMNFRSGGTPVPQGTPRQ